MSKIDRPWSAPVHVEDVPETGLHVDLAADEEVRRALAPLVGVNAIPRLQASFDVARSGRGLHVVGTVSATVGQTCGVTLDPLENEVNEPVDLLFAPVSDAPEVAAEADRPAAVETPEPLVGGCADLGAVATEFLILGIDPYPRKPGAVFAQPAPDRSPGPFAGLSVLKKGAGKD